MKKFISYGIYITILLGVIILTIMIFKSILYKNLDYKLPEEKHILFMGASGIEVGIDDSKMSSAMNVAYIGERAMRTYLKLKYILRDNNHIDTIFMHMNNHTLSERADYGYLSINGPFNIIPDCFPLFGLEEWMIFVKNNPAVLFYVTKKLISEYYFDSSSYLYSLGHYTKNEKYDFDRDNYQHKEGDEVCGHKINDKYLHKIIELCKQNSIKLYFVSTPIYTPAYKNEIKSFKELYIKNYSETELLDYSEWEVEDSCRADVGHLNDKGAQLFTEEIKRRFNIK